MSKEKQQIEKFDPSKLMEGVKDRIKATFVSLIPDDMWNQMVEKEIFIFTTGRIVEHYDIDYSQVDEDGRHPYTIREERVPYNDNDVYNSWGRLEKPAEIAPLRRMIRDELEKKFRANLKDYLNGDEYQKHFDAYGKPEIGKAIKKVLVDNADTIFISAMESMMQSVFEQMRHQLISQGNY